MDRAMELKLASLMAFPGVDTNVDEPNFTTTVYPRSSISVPAAERYPLHPQIVALSAGDRIPLRGLRTPM